MPFLTRRAKSTQMAEPDPDGVLTAPTADQALGHIDAMNFGAALVGREWHIAEQIWAQQSHDEDRSNLISTATQMGGSPDYLTPWVESSNDPFLPLLVRGASSITWAWNARSGHRANRVTQEMFDEFFRRLNIAEADLVAAAGAGPDSPLPWAHLVTSARGLQIPKEEALQRFENSLARGPVYGAHKQYLQFVCKKWFGSHDDMWEFTEAISSLAPDGSPMQGLVPIALMEHWISGDVEAESFEAFVHQIGKYELLSTAAHRSYGHPAFPVPRSDAASSMSAFVAVFVAMRNWPAAKALVPMLGSRFDDFPLVYFSDAKWPDLSASIMRK